MKLTKITKPVKRGDIVYTDSINNGTYVKGVIVSIDKYGTLKVFLPYCDNLAVPYTWGQPDQFCVREYAQTSIDTGKKSKMTTEHKALIKAHNESVNGIKLGVSKELKKSHHDTPLFKNPDQQTNLF